MLRLKRNIVSLCVNIILTSVMLPTRIIKLQKLTTLMKPLETKTSGRNTMPCSTIPLPVRLVRVDSAGNQRADKVATAGKILKVSLAKAKLMAMAVFASMIFFPPLVAGQVDNRSVAVLARKIVRVKTSMQRLRLIWLRYMTVTITALN